VDRERDKRNQWTHERSQASGLRPVWHAGSAHAHDASLAWPGVACGRFTRPGSLLVAYSPVHPTLVIGDAILGPHAHLGGRVCSGLTCRSCLLPSGPEGVPPVAPSCSVPMLPSSSMRKLFLDRSPLLSPCGGASSSSSHPSPRPVRVPGWPCRNGTSSFFHERQRRNEPSEHQIPPFADRWSLVLRASAGGPTRIWSFMKRPCTHRKARREKAEASTLSSTVEESLFDQRMVEG
jgi:hypothetical protein